MPRILSWLIEVCQDGQSPAHAYKTVNDTSMHVIGWGVWVTVKVDQTDPPRETLADRPPKRD